MGIRQDFEEAIRHLYRQVAAMLDEDWKRLTGNLITGNKINASALPVDGSTITVTSGPGGPVITAGGGGVGTVTSIGIAAPSSILSVSGSPVTHSGTITLSLATQISNTVWAGPATGIAATPTFRGLVPADIPSLDAAKIATGTFSTARLPLATVSTVGVVKIGTGLSVDGSGNLTVTAAGLTDATPTAVGVVQADQSPPTGHPKALTLMSRYTPNGLASVGTEGMFSTVQMVIEGARGSVAEAGRWVQSPHNPLFGGATSSAAQEPNVIVKEDGTLVMFFTKVAGGVGANGRLAMATCPGDPTIAANWTIVGDVLGKGASGYSGAVEHTYVFRLDGLYYCYFGTTNSGDWMRATSPTGAAGTWSTPVLVLGQHDEVWSGGWNNSYVWQEATTWWAIVEGDSSGAFLSALFTSTDAGLTWTSVTGGFLSTLRPNGGVGTASVGFMFIPQRRDGLYHLWYHGDTTGTDLPTDIYHATSPDKITWTILNSGNPVISRPGGGVYDQVADPCLFEWHGKTYLAYERVINSSSTFEICIASVDCNAAQLIDGINPVSTPTALTDLTDVALTSPAVGDVLTWDGADWVNAVPPIYAPLMDSSGAFILDSLGAIVMARIN